MHGYVLMGNHFHLLVKTPLGNLSRFMQRLNTAYTVYFNRWHERVGHLFQGRYKSPLVDADPYLLELSRYIHLNPVRGLIKNIPVRKKIAILENYEWSSFPYYIGIKSKKIFIHTDLILSMLNADLSQALQDYRQFVLKVLPTKLASPFKDGPSQLVLGNTSFTKWVYKKFIDEKREDSEYTKLEVSLPVINFDYISRCVADEYNVKPAEIIKRRSKLPLERQVLIELCCRYLVKEKSLKEIGEMLDGISVSGVGISRRRLKAKMKNDSALKKRFKKIKDRIFS